MKTSIKLFLLSFLLGLTFSSFSQKTAEIKLNPEKVEKFWIYVANMHGGPDVFDKWKETNKMLYAQEMWYYSESFYVKRNYSPEGVPLNESIICIHRFEDQRKENEEVIITLPGFKDAIVLLPAKTLIYKPN